jgi:hypothetical protein
MASGRSVAVGDTLGQAHSIRTSIAMDGAFHLAEQLLRTTGVAVKVLLVVIDAATPRVVCPAIRTGRLPFLQQLAEAGSMHEASASIFPSITPAATTTIITGEYPVGHGIAGASWYEPSTGDIAYYGDDFWTAAKEGFGTFLRDFLVRLNGDRLVAPTLFETVEDAGRVAGCLNYLVYKGRVQHTVNIPWLLTVLPGVPLTETILGPTVCCVGDFVTTRTRRGRKLRNKGGALHRFGMDDASTGALLCELIEDGHTPDLTVAYFADNDFRGHDVGPHEALPVLEGRRDAGRRHRRGRRAGSLPRAHVRARHLRSRALRGARRQGPRGRAPRYRARGVPQAVPGRPWKEDDDILICPNMRAAQVYLREPSRDSLDAVVRAMLAHPGIDQVLWHAPLGGGVEGEYVVVTAGGRLRFRRDDGPGAVRDAFGAGWSWHGDEHVLGIVRDGAHVAFDEYPNAFERIAGLLEGQRTNECWVTARPGCEFEIPGGAAHVGGASHGSLHALDSLSPVVAAGLPAGHAVPGPMRSVDLAPLCLDVLGLPSPHRVGAPRVTAAASGHRR